MADPDRLQQLRRQRAKIAEHLAWLDEEIHLAQADDLPPSLQSVTSPGPPMPAAAVHLESRNPSPGLTSDPDAVLEQWTETETDQHDKPVSKTGCWIIFGVIAIVGIGTAVTLIYSIY